MEAEHDETKTSFLQKRVVALNPHSPDTDYAKYLDDVGLAEYHSIFVNVQPLNTECRLAAIKRRIQTAIVQSGCEVHHGCRGELVQSGGAARHLVTRLVFGSGGVEGMVVVLVQQRSGLGGRACLAFLIVFAACPSRT